MNKKFEERCNVLGTLWLFYRDDAEKDEVWNDFFEHNDIGLPLAYLINQKIVTPTADGGGEQYVEETWEMFCEIIEIDPAKRYKDLKEAFEASPNPPLPEEEDE